MELLNDTEIGNLKDFRIKWPKYRKSFKGIVHVKTMRKDLLNLAKTCLSQEFEVKTAPEVRYSTILSRSSNTNINDRYSNKSNEITYHRSDRLYLVVSKRRSYTIKPLRFRKHAF